MRAYKVDVPVCIDLWSRPECQRRQFEIIREAAPSILFILSDGGRNEEEMALIRESRKIVSEIDWDCQVYRLYFEENQGMYGMQTHLKELVWRTVDRCIFLEDDDLPAVSFFQYCAELLEKYKDDERIEMICGNNVFGAYPEAEPYDYFFTRTGWSIWGTATWKRVADTFRYPLDYAENTYIKRCLKDELPEFWYKKVMGYCNGKMVDNHVPGEEYFHGINSVLYHRVSIVPTRNMIDNIGYQGTHFNFTKEDASGLFNLKRYEVDFPLKHPAYVIDDRQFGERYLLKLGHKTIWWKQAKGHIKRLVYLLTHGGLIKAIKGKLHPEMEK